MRDLPLNYALIHIYIYTYIYIYTCISIKDAAVAAVSSHIDQH